VLNSTFRCMQFRICASMKVDDNILFYCGIDLKSTIGIETCHASST